MFTPRLPGAAKALSLILGWAHMHREHGLSERNGVGERMQRGEIEHRHRDDGEAVHLCRVILRLGQACGDRRREPGRRHAHGPLLRAGVESWR